MIDLPTISGSPICGSNDRTIARILGELEQAAKELSLGGIQERSAGGFLQKHGIDPNGFVWK